MVFYYDLWTVLIGIDNCVKEECLEESLYKRDYEIYSFMTLKNSWTYF